MQTIQSHIAFKLTGKDILSDTQRQTLTLLYLPVIGKDAYALYMYCESLLERSKLKTPAYPHSLLFDAVELSSETFTQARAKLEAVGLLDSYKGEDDYLYRLYHPLSAEAFIKDSPFISYLDESIGQERLKELLEHFKITRVQTANYTNVTAEFSDVFNPLYKPLDTRSQYLDKEVKKATLTHAFNSELVLESIPSTLLDTSMHTLAVKERFKTMAYVYSLKEKDFTALLKKSLKQNGHIDFDKLTRLAQTHYQKLPKNRYTKEHMPHNLETFKHLHPKTLVESCTGGYLAAAELKTVERLITELNMPHEVINVMLAYVLKEKDNHMPTFNYFEKIAAEWKRSDIMSASQAIDHIKKRLSKQQAPRYQSNRREKMRPVDTNVDWFDDYLKEQEE